MRKILFAVALMVGLSFTSCGNQTTATEDADTTVVDTVVVDTLVVDTVVAE